MTGRAMNERAHVTTLHRFGLALVVTAPDCPHFVMLRPAGLLLRNYGRVAPYLGLLREEGKPARLLH